MFLLGSSVRFWIVLLMVVLFVAACSAPVSAQSCNSGVNNSQLQANVTANQALALQQAALARAAAAPQQTVTAFQPRTVYSPTLPVSSLVAAPACATCNQQVAQAPLQRPASQQPQLVLTLPGSNKPAPPGRYVLAPPPTATSRQLARN